MGSNRKLSDNIASASIFSRWSPKNFFTISYCGDLCSRTHLDHDSDAPRSRISSHHSRNSSDPSSMRQRHRPHALDLRQSSNHSRSTSKSSAASWSESARTPSPVKSPRAASIKTNATNVDDEGRPIPRPPVRPRGATSLTLPTSPIIPEDGQPLYSPALPSRLSLSSTRPPLSPRHAFNDRSDSPNRRVRKSFDGLPPSNNAVKISSPLCSSSTINIGPSAFDDDIDAPRPSPSSRIRFAGESQTSSRSSSPSYFSLDRGQSNLDDDEAVSPLSAKILRAHHEDTSKQSLSRHTGGVGSLHEQDHHHSTQTLQDLDDTAQESDADERLPRRSNSDSSSRRRFRSPPPTITFDEEEDDEVIDSDEEQDRTKDEEDAVEDEDATAELTADDLLDLMRHSPWHHCCELCGKPIQRKSDCEPTYVRCWKCRRKTSTE